MQASRHQASIRQRLAAGETPAAIATSLGVARSTVYRARGAQGRRKGDAAAYGSISARLSEKEVAALGRLVGAGRSRAAVLRSLVRHAAGFFASRPDEQVFLASADRHLSRLGGNFNQIAAALSVSVRKIGRADPTREQIESMHRAADDIVEIRAVLRQMLDNSQHRATTLRAALEEGVGETSADG